MSQWIFAFLALGAGVCLALQATANTRFRANLDSAYYAAYFSICGTFITATTLMLLFRPALPTMEAMRRTQWWNYMGGPLGTLIVLAGATLVSRLGAAAFLAFMVAGQLLSSLVMDHYEIMGLPHQPFTMGKLLGVLMVIGGVVCIKYL